MGERIGELFCCRQESCFRLCWLVLRQKELSLQVLKAAPLPGAGNRLPGLIQLECDLSGLVCQFPTRIEDAGCEQISDLQSCVWCTQDQVCLKACFVGLALDQVNATEQIASYQLQASSPHR